MTAVKSTPRSPQLQSHEQQARLSATINKYIDFFFLSAGPGIAEVLDVRGAKAKRRHEFNGEAENKL